MTETLLLLGYGNPSRGDDALGVLVLDFVAQQLRADNLLLITDFQLQIEHALDLQNQTMVLFVDAAVNCDTPIRFEELQPAVERSYTTHALRPEAVLQVYQSITGQTPPPCFLLRIQGTDFELGAALSPAATTNLHLACRFITQLLANPSVEHWRCNIS